MDKSYHPDVNLFILSKNEGHLPFHGGLANQPATLIEKWLLIEDAKHALQELDKEMERKKNA